MRTEFLEKIINCVDFCKLWGFLQNPMSPLSLGEINCREGWLYSQLKLMSEGITGRLYE